MKSIDPDPIQQPKSPSPHLWGEGRGKGQSIDSHPIEKKVVLALMTEAFGGAGGIAQYNRDLLGAMQALSDLGSVHVLVRSCAGESSSPRIIQHPPRRRRLGYALVALLLACKVRPDVIFCGHLYMLPLAVLLGALLRKPVWLQIHGLDAWQPPGRWVPTLIKRVSLVTSVSRHTRRRFLSWAMLPHERVRVLPNTVPELSRPVDRQAMRRKLGLTDHRVLLTVGRLAASEAYKGHDRILQCLPALRSQYPDLIYLIAGTGDDQGRLQQLAEQCGLADCVRFLGEVSAEDRTALYAAADLFVMPSTGEGFGIVYLEAMACGTPALGLDEDGSRDPLRDGELGFVSSRCALGETIAHALSQPRPENLAARTQRWFGQASFRGHVAKLLQTWPGWHVGANT